MAEFNFERASFNLYLLFLLFLGLKLAGEIGWSWWWVTAPLWGMYAFGFTLLFIAFLLGILVKGTSAYTKAQARSRLMARAVKKEEDSL